ncbi:MAG: hypothetical protein NVSMB29_18630 [Candidatus Dormibacteria bacterium]
MLRDWFTTQRPRLARDERGQGLVEYALVLVLIVLVVIVIVGVLGVRVNNMYSNVSNGIAN